MSDIRTKSNGLILSRNGFTQLEPIIAQIAPGKDSEKAFVETLPKGKFKDNATTSADYWRPGYKIFFCGEHDPETPVSVLPWATPYGPSGLRNESSSFPVLPPNTYVEVLRHGSRDGVPFYWIVNILPNYAVNLDGTKTETECKPGSGYVPGSTLYYVPKDSLGPDGKSIAPGAEANISVPNLADKRQNSDNESIIIPQPIECVKVDTAAINNKLAGALKAIQDARTELLGDDSFIRTSQEFLDSVQSAVGDASDFIAKKIAWLINEIRQRAMRVVNTAVNNTVGNAYLSIRYQILEANDKALDLMSCLFLKLLNNLGDIVRSFINGFVDQFLNTGICVIESFLTTLMGNIMAQLQGAIGAILGPLQTLLGSAVNLINTVLGFVDSILDFLTCDIEQLCPVTNEWNFLEGGLDSSSSTIPDLNFNAIFESAKAFGNNLIALGNIPSDLANTNFDIGLDSALNAAAGCLGGVGGTGLFECGPPKVIFWGADGNGATGNVVVSLAGEILGVDIITPGRGYSKTKPPAVQFEDNCGSGSGVVGTAVVGDYEYTDPDTGETSTETGVLDVIIDNPGYDYLPYPDGSYGGGGRTVADRCQSILRRGDTNKWEGPFNEGEVIEIREGDFVIIAGQPPYVSEENTSITVPGCPPDFVSPETGSTGSNYSVITEIGNVNVVDGGFGFTDGDTITVTPDNGAILEPVITNGVITSVNIINPGVGFDAIPDLELNTSTGYNAILNAVLNFNTVDNNVAFNIPEGAKLISVVDCVGKN